jgi:hypothetical protein
MHWLLAAAATAPRVIFCLKGLINQLEVLSLMQRQHGLSYTPVGSSTAGSSAAAAA